MPDRPIIFSAPMIAALLASRKTQTRRLLALPKWASADPSHVEEQDDGSAEVICRDTGCLAAVPMRFAVGDRLWVKENHRLVDCTCDTCRVPGYVYFEADGDGYEGARLNRLRPSIHMPRWASRLTLAVTKVRVERLQDISEADAIAEGIEHWPAGSPIIGNPYGVGLGEGNGWCSGGTAKEAFQALWQRINGPEAWQANPWIVAVTFSVHARNIDQLAPIPTEAACA